jgi:DNA-binding NarL/FixJ family response regulator
MFETKPFEKITILIADDHKLVREAWRYVLNSHPGFIVIGESGDAEDAVEKARILRPRLVIMDINLPVMNGIEATRQIRKYSPGSKILGVSLHTQPTYVRKMMQAGALGYITKNSKKEEMFLAIQELEAGRKYICEEVKDILAERLNPEHSYKGINALSSRELEIIEQVRQGNSSKEIAFSLNIAVKTVEVHRHNILKKLDLKNSSALINLVNNSQLGFVN